MAIIEQIRSNVANLTFHDRPDQKCNLAVRTKKSGD